jgi:Glyoxalase-like domain
VPVRFQLVIDCADADRLARFWAVALGYELAPAPSVFATWNDFYRELGVRGEELADGADRISDPDGYGPSIWFHVVPDATAVKNAGAGGWDETARGGRLAVGRDRSRLAPDPCGRASHPPRRCAPTMRGRASGSRRSGMRRLPYDGG